MIYSKGVHCALQHAFLDYKKGVFRKLETSKRLSVQNYLTVEAPENQIMSERGSWSSNSKFGPLT